MVQMINDGPAINEFARAAKMIKTRTQIGILTDAPAGVILIETVHRDQIFAPERHVATNDAAMLAIAPNDRKRQSKCLRHAGDAPRHAPSADTGAFRGKFRNEFFLDKAAAPLHPEIFFSKRGMVADELMMRHAIAIQQNQIIACRRGNGLVEDDRFTKATVLVPHMPEGKARLPGFDKFARRFA